MIRTQHSDSCRCWFIGSNVIAAWFPVDSQALMIVRGRVLRWPPRNTTRAGRAWSRVVRAWHRLRYAVRMLRAMYWPLGPVYILRYSRDCDLMHAWWPEEHPSMFSVYRAMERAAWDAEGPFGYTVIPEAEYRGVVCRVWDEAAERAGY